MTLRAAGLYTAKPCHLAMITCHTLPTALFIYNLMMYPHLKCFFFPYSLPFLYCFLRTTNRHVLHTIFEVGLQNKRVAHPALSSQSLRNMISRASYIPCMSHVWIKTVHHHLHCCHHYLQLDKYRVSSLNLFTGSHLIRTTSTKENEAGNMITGLGDRPLFR